MTYNPDIHHRHSIRLKDYDYSQAGAYFVTICAWQRECLFGEIVDGVMILNDVGRIVETVWCHLPEQFKNATLDEYVIMPNHFHGIIFLSDSVGATPSARPDTQMSEKDGRPVGIAPTGPLPGSIGAVMAQFKSNVTKRINKFRNNPGCPVWQRNYYERVIRNEDELSRAREYIVNNPMKWELDKENPVNCPEPSKPVGAIPAGRPIANDNGSNTGEPMASPLQNQTIDPVEAGRVGV
jgi:REP element-mobilizing transposase RayT